MVSSSMRRSVSSNCARLGKVNNAKRRWAVVSDCPAFCAMSSASRTARSNSELGDAIVLGSKEVLTEGQVFTAALVHVSARSHQLLWHGSTTNEALLVDEK